MTAHRLGPHVVGQRIVLRRVVRGERGPSGGPALTDLLGVCRSWDADDSGVVVVAPAEGEPVSVPIGDIVSGKPVPPRPSVRFRVSAAAAEAHTAALFPGLQTTDLAGWTARWEPDPGERLRRRANSALAMSPSTVPVADALARVRTFYAARDRTPLVQVEQGSRFEAEVAAAGWRPVPGADSIFLLAALAPLHRRLPAADPEELPVTVVGDRMRIRTPQLSADAALDGDWLGVHGLRVDPGHRRRGWASAALAALAEIGAERGARTVWLHLETGNAGAAALYDHWGFGEHHRCRYYAAP